MRILVTGAAGYIGTHLIQELKLKNHEILALSGRSQAKNSRLNHIGVGGIAGDTTDLVFCKGFFLTSNLQ